MDGREMAEILPFALGRGRPSAGGRETPCEIVFFPGVRVEYHDGSPEPRMKREERRARRGCTKDALSA